MNFMGTDEQDNLSPHGITSTRANARRQVPHSIRHTNLAMYIQTRQTRYLIAFLGHFVGMGMVVLITITLFKAAYTGELIRDEQSKIVGGILMDLGIASFAFLVSALAETNLMNALKAGIGCAFVFFIYSLRG